MALEEYKRKRDFKKTPEPGPDRTQRRSKKLCYLIQKHDPVLAGSSAYALAEAAAWRGSLEHKPRTAGKFYTVLAISLILGCALDYAGLDAVKMLFWSAVINGALAPPLILLILLLTGNREVMGDRVNPPAMRLFGWLTFAIMSAATIGMFLT